MPSCRNLGVDGYILEALKQNAVRLLYILTIYGPNKENVDADITF